MSYLDWVRRWVPVCLLVVISFSGTSVYAQGSGSAELQERLNELFDQSRHEPDNLDVLFELSRVAVELGDFESAIGALERMLIFNPDLPRVKLELGVLYFRLQAFELARSYLEQVQESDAPQEVKQRVAGYLHDIERQTKRFNFGGIASLGIAHSSNPAAMADQGAEVNVGSSDLPFVTGRGPASDQRLQFSGALSASHVLETQWDDAILGEIKWFGLRYLEQDELDLGVVEGTVGSAFSLERFDLPGTVQPFLAGSYVQFDDAGLFWDGGGGIKWRGSLLSGRLSTLTGYEYRSRSYNSRADAAAISERDGHWHRFSLQSQAPVGSGSIDFGAAFRIYSARVQHQSFNEWSVRIGASRPWQTTWKRPLLLGSTISLRGTRYDGPDPTIQPDTRRSDNEIRLEGSAQLPIKPRLLWFCQAAYTYRFSNVDVYEYDDWSITSGVTWTF